MKKLLTMPYKQRNNYHDIVELLKAVSRMKTRRVILEIEKSRVRILNYTPEANLTDVQVVNEQIICTVNFNKENSEIVTKAIEDWEDIYCRMRILPQFLGKDMIEISPFYIERTTDIKKIKPFIWKKAA